MLYTTPVDALHLVLCIVILGLCAAAMETPFLKLLTNSSCADVAVRGSLELLN